MSSELYDKFARMNCIDQAIFESEQEIANGAEAVDAEVVFISQSYMENLKIRNEFAISETVIVGDTPDYLYPKVN